MHKDRSQGSFGPRKRWLALDRCRWISGSAKNHLNRVGFFWSPVPWGAGIWDNIVLWYFLAKGKTTLGSDSAWAGASCRSCQHVSEDWLGANACGKTQGWLSGSCYLWYIHSGKHTKSHGKSPSLIGKSTTNGQFSIAMLVYQRVVTIQLSWEATPSKYHSRQWNSPWPNIGPWRCSNGFFWCCSIDQHGELSVESLGHLVGQQLA